MKTKLRDKNVFYSTMSEISSKTSCRPLVAVGQSIQTNFLSRLEREWVSLHHSPLYSGTR
ncbi:MAG TPA: hypothetical protein VKA38_12545 [Draconibacterium sp.]|nr:hypothetical protein [Draconibacterium sp.]